MRSGFQANYLLRSSVTGLSCDHGLAAGRLDSYSDAHPGPDTDVYGTEGSLVIKVELGGMRKEDLEVTVEGNRLKISGQRPDGRRAPKRTFLGMDINYGAVEDIIEVPTG